MKRITKEDALAMERRVSRVVLKFRGGGMNAQADSAKNNDQDADGEQIGYAQGKAEDHGQDAQPAATVSLWFPVETPIFPFAAAKPA